MKIKSIAILGLLSISTFYAQSKTKSGLLLNGGSGSIKTDLFQSKLSIDNITNTEINYKSNFSVGYRFRLVPAVAPVLFIDLDANIGLKLWNSSYRSPISGPAAYEASSKYYFVSTAASVNYPIIKGLSVGAGIEPTYYLKREGEYSEQKIDIPIIGKVAYKFNWFELGATYKFGVMNSIKTKYISCGKFRDWQLSLWIPF